jgi:hypothetical protein
MRAEELNGLVVEIQRVNGSTPSVGAEARNRVCLLPDASWQDASEWMLEQPTNLPALASEESRAKHIQISEQADSAVYPGVKIQTLP